MIGLKKKPDQNRVLHLIDDKASFAYTEAYKSLRTNIDFLASTNNYRSIVVTSSGPRDGKTNIAINLAVTLGGSGKRVILLDCDLRKPSVGAYLKLNRGLPGISSVLSGKSTIEAEIVHQSELHIDVIPAGALPANPSEVVGSAAMVNLIQALRKQYDFVVIDSPPVSVVTDAAILSRFADSVLLVARANITTRQSLSTSKKNLEDVNARILGVVLNDFDAKSRAYGRGSYYSYSYKYGYYGTKKK